MQFPDEPLACIVRRMSGNSCHRRVTTLYPTFTPQRGFPFYIGIVKTISSRLAATCVTAIAALLLATACNTPPHAYVEGDPDDLPRLRFEDGSVSSNDRCPVLGNKLNRAFDPLYVNGRPVGFC